MSIGGPHEVLPPHGTGGRLDAIVESVHAHPALPQWLEEAAKSAAAAELALVRARS